MASKNSNTSSKYKDIISKSVQIHSGSPAVYQLKPKKEKFGTLTRMTVGQKNPKKKNKTILLVGESGAGKSILVNALLNYSMGVKWEDDVWFQIVEKEDEGGRSRCESQTSDVIVYEIFGFEDKTLPYSLTIIDTPGFGDTRGTEHDDIISHRLFDLFRSQDGVHELHAVGLVMKSSDNRVNDRLMYVLDSVMSLFGEDMEKSIVALITHSSKKKATKAVKFLEAANIKCARNEKNQPVHFPFDNSQDEERTEEEEDDLHHADEISTKGMRDFTAFLKETEPQKLTITTDVLNERISLTACIQNLQQKLKLIELKQTEIKQIQEALKKHEEKKENEKFTVEVDEVYKHKEIIECGMRWLVFYQAATCCTVCEETCHYPGCTKAWKPEHCEVMKKGRCTVCTNKCPASDHVKEKWKYVIKTRKVKKTLEKIEEKYQKNETESDSKSIHLKMNLEQKMKQLTAKKSQLLDESYQHVVRLEQIALKADSASTYVHLDFLIEKMKDKRDRVKVQKLEELRSKMDDRTKSALRYKQLGKQP